MSREKLRELAQQMAAHMGVEPRGKPQLRVVGRSEPEAETDGQPEALALPDWTAIQPIDVSPRARKMHEIMMVANAHCWQIAITHFLMTRGVSYLSDLTDPQLDDLLGRMHGYVDAAETGASLEDCLPAS